jgi:long-chain acyl-CoA synthetase
MREKIGFTLLQGYGLTETSPIISCNSPKAKKIGSIGKVLEGVNVILVLSTRDRLAGYDSRW